MKVETLAAIDIGTNAIRLMISNIEKQGRKEVFKKLALIRVPLRLGEDVFTKGHISEEKKNRLSEALVGFSHLMIAFDVMDYRACGTSALREANNTDEVLELVKSTSGIEIEVIPGLIEADRIFKASQGKGIISGKKTYCYVDVGGGSTELIIYKNGEMLSKDSFPLGTVRFLTGQVDKSAKQHFKLWLKEAYKKYKPDTIIGSGGNINKIHKLLNKRRNECIEYDELVTLYEDMKPMSIDERMENYELNSYRADVILPALRLFISVAKECHVDKIMVPKVGLSDGIIYELNKTRKNKELLE